VPVYWLFEEIPPGVLRQTACAVALAALPAPAPGQVLSFSARSDLVVFSATAIDGKGRPITDLRREDFRIYEDGRPQPIAHFHGGQGLPARILLLVDASGSMAEEYKVASARRAARQILEALGPDDQAAVAGFDSRYWGVVAFTSDREALRKGLDSITPFGSTALHDALDKAAHDIASHGEGRRAVVVLTDGVDTSSQQAPDDVIARSRALDVPIYAVSVVSPLDDPASPSFVGKKETAEAAAAAETLSRYATLSGGAAFRVSDALGLRLAADRIAGELKHQYRLGWDAPEGSSRFRRVVVLSTRKGITVRTRSGYVPPSESSPGDRAGNPSTRRLDKEVIE
jgi:Ca-activated chloride channel family protein